MSREGRGVRTGIVGVALLAAGGAACAGILGIGDRVLDPDLSEGGLEAGAADTNTGEGSVVDSGGAKESGPIADAGVDSGCGDLQSDPTSCGTCMHSCLGGACEAGVCQPLALTPADGGNIYNPTDIQVDDASVYWADPFAGAVNVADKTTGANQTVLFDMSATSGAVEAPLHLAIDSTNIYASDEDGHVFACAKGGCGGNPTSLGLLNAGSTSPDFVAVGGGYVYATVTSGTVWRMPTNGSTGPTLVTTYSPALPGDAGETSLPYAITVDSSYVYFTNGDGTVQKAPITGASSPTLVCSTSQEAAGGIFLANGLLYFTLDIDPGGSVNSVSTSGGTSTLIQGGEHQPAAVVADATNLYWVTSGSLPSMNNGTVMMCPLTNCSMPTVLASGRNEPLALAVDETAVYWVELGIMGGSAPVSGGVYKVAKP